MKKICIFVMLSLLCVPYAYGFETRNLPAAPCAPVQSEVVESQIIPPGQMLAESGTTIPQTVSPNPIETQENTNFSAKEAELAEREKAVAEREKVVAEREKAIAERERAIAERKQAVEQREAALTDWYAKLSEYREYLNECQAKSKTQTVVRPTYSTFSYGGMCANGLCYGGW